MWRERVGEMCACCMSCACGVVMHELYMWGGGSYACTWAHNTKHRPTPPSHTTQNTTPHRTPMCTMHWVRSSLTATKTPSTFSPPTPTTILLWWASMQRSATPTWRVWHTRGGNVMMHLLHAPTGMLVLCGVVWCGAWCWLCCVVWEQHDCLP